MAVHCLILLQIILFLLPIKVSQSRCPTECGVIRLQYPFGIGEGCYFDKSFEVICSCSSGSEIAVLKSTKLELSSMYSYSSPYIAINISVISLNSSKSTRNSKGVNLSGTPFSFSQSENKFAAIGCDNFSIINTLRSNDSTSSGGCFSICTCDPTRSQHAACCNFLCTIPPNSKVFDANTAYTYSRSIPEECTSVSMVQQYWLFSDYRLNSSVLREEEKVPALLEWGSLKGTCFEDFNSGDKTCSSDNYCLIQLGSGYICLCEESRSNFYQGVCEGSLIFNTTSGYNGSQCPPGYYPDPPKYGSKPLYCSRVLRETEKVPTMLESGKFRGKCIEDFNSGNKSCNLHDYCLIQLGSGYICLCQDSRSNSYQGVCEGYLICNTTSGYNCSQCPPGYDQEPFEYDSELPYCSSLRTNLMGKKSRVKFIVIGCSSGGLGMLFLVIGAWWLNKFIKRRREMKRKQKFFKRNGGLLLQQELSSTESHIEKIKVFTSKELERATDNFNANRILGQGGQGTVYKGMLANGKIVAVKRSKVVDESKIEEFINEVVILSQINHRNMVKLLGCCLETEVPLLVYEFISNGNLFEYLHDQNQEFPITWEMRLRIVVEVSSAVSYLHSAASIPIYHRDIKSTNILLDDKYRAKVSDFGTSRSMAVDQTHLTTQVHGTFGYLDPEYFRSSQFTNKSDVYSFGVVLAELLTGEKPIRSINSEEDKSLAAYFLAAMKEDCLFEILDARALKEGRKDEIIGVAKLAKRCLSLNGKKRPTMKEVATELAGIIGWNEASMMQEMIDSEECDIILSSNLFETSSSFTVSEAFVDSVTFSVDVDPLISNNW